MTPTVPSIIDLYLESLLVRHVAGEYAKDALSNARRELRRFADSFAIAITDCRQHDLTRWLSINPQWKSSCTKKRVASTILACFRWAEEEELVPKCQYHWPKSLKGLPDKVRRPADPFEYVALMRGGSRELRRALFFLRRTGCRTCEMRELCWQDVHDDHISLEKHKTRRKTGRARKYGLDRSTANFLRALRRNRQGHPEDHVFLNCEGGKWDRHTFARHLRRWAKRIGLDEGVETRVSAYCLRHTYAVDAIEAGVTSRQIADQQGHERTGMIDTVYGSHTRQRTAHLNSVAEDILRKRLRKPKE